MVTDMERSLDFYTRVLGLALRDRRLLEPIGNIPPAEAEARYYAMLEEPAMAA
jgi:catechol 2,3-dioxygenase-like lactoylglutathione lyase family enzyme